MLQDRAKPRYDRDELKKHAEEIATHYLGPGHNEGDSRMLWNCPACGKENKYSIRRRDQLAGCMNSGCELGGGADILTLIAYFEQLDVRNEFTKVLKRGYEIVGLGGDLQRRQHPDNETQQPRARQPQATRRTPEQQREWLALCHRIYERVMSLCSLEERDRKYLRGRGLTYETIDAGRFGSMSAERAGYLKETLLKEFGKEDLLRVPGFFEDHSGRLGFTLTGDYLLIPYHDRVGNITNVEGRTMGEIPKHMGKYVSLRGSGNHLYLFPSLAPEPDEIMAFTEGVFGAIVAAQNSLVVGSIQGCKRYQARSSDLSPESGDDDNPLPELRGIDFGGRAIPYIPDADDPPNADVLDAAPKAAHHLVERRGGAGTLCTLPRGMDLDEWLLTLPKKDRREKFVELISGAAPLADAGRWKEELINPDHAASSAGTTGDTDGPDHTPDNTTNEEQREETTPPEPGAAPEEVPQAKADRGDEPSDKDQPSSEDASQETEDNRGGPEIVLAVYERLLEKCPPTEAHKAALAHRGILERAIEVGRLGSVDPARAVRVVAELKEEFGAENLERVPGFERGNSGRVSLSLPAKGEYVLLPCRDARGVLRGLEALEYDPEKTDFTAPEKTLSFTGAHLYVFAHHSPAEIEGFCEGPLGAILAAQEDVVLGAVGHFRRYSTGKDTDAKKQGDTILPELAGVDFGGRRIAYVPVSGPGEGPSRTREADHACRYLIEKQKGKPELIFPSTPGPATPGASDHPTSMSGWISSLPRENRQQKLKEIFPESPNRTTEPGQENANKTPGDKGRAADATNSEYEETQEKRFRLPPTTTLAVMGATSLVAAVVCYLLIGRLRSFSEYVGVGFGGQPFIEGGPVGSLRLLARSAPFDFLYAHAFSLSLLAGLIAFSVAFHVWHTRRRVVDLTEDLQQFAQGPWSAHRLDGGPRDDLLWSLVETRDLVGSLLAAVFASAFIYLVLTLAGTAYAGLTALGAVSGAYAFLFHAPTILALIAGLATGVYVLINRSGKHRGRARIALGRIR